MFHIFKRSRSYEGHPYCGPSSNFKSMAFDTIEEARVARDHLESINPVGWDIYNEWTRMKIEDTYDEFTRLKIEYIINPTI